MRDAFTYSNLVITYFKQNDMKKIFKLKWMFASALMVVALAGCSKDDDNGEGGDPIGGGEEYYLFQEKTGTIVYSSSYDNEPATTWKLIFDNYGKQMRIEMEGAVQIADDDAQKVYILYPEQQTYMEHPYSSAASMRYAFIYLGDDAGAAWTHYPNFQKSSKTIAGKSCTVCSWSDDGDTAEWGGWKRITFYTKTTASDGLSSLLQATSFSGSIPANSFTPPAGYSQLSF